MKYAVIDIPSCEVVNIIIWDGVAPLSLPVIAPYSVSYNLIAVGDLPCDFGWKWNGAEFIRPQE